jgi:hypothetical protein
MFTQHVMGNGDTERMKRRENGRQSVITDTAYVDALHRISVLGVGDTM